MASAPKKRCELWARMAMYEAKIANARALKPLLDKLGIDLSERQIQRIVTGRSRSVNLDVVGALAEIFNCAPGDLLRMVPTTPKQKPSEPAKDDSEVSVPPVRGLRRAAS